MDVRLCGSTLGLAGGHQSAPVVEGQAGQGLAVHSAVQDAPEATLRLHKDCHGGPLGRVCGQEESLLFGGNDHKSLSPCPCSP